MSSQKLRLKTARQSPSENSVATPLILGALIAFALIVSAFFFADLSLRLDEAQSLWQTSHSPSQIFTIVAQDVHVPLYHLLLHIWQAFLGNNVSTARALSLAFFLINIPVFYALGKLAYDRPTALFATVLFAISPFMLWYGNEIRMYSLFTLVITLNYYFFISTYKKDTDWSWIGYGATAIIGMYTHYFFALAIFTQILFFAMYRELFPKHSLRRFMTTALLVILTLTPWLLYVYMQGAASNTRPLLTEPSAVNVFNTLSQFLFGFQNDTINSLIVALWPLSVLVVFLGLRKNKRVTPVSIFFVMAFAIPIIIAFILSTTLQPLFLSRYLILTLPPLFLFLSWILSAYPKRLGAPLKTLFVGVVLIMLGIQAWSTQVPVKEDYREAAMYLNQETTVRDVIVVSAPFTIYPVEYYYQGSAPIQTIPPWDRSEFGPIPEFSEESLPENVDNIADAHERIWLLLSYDQGYEEEIKSYFDNNYERLLEHPVSPGLNLSLYRLRYDIQSP